MATQVAESWSRRFNDACVPARPVYTPPGAYSHTDREAAAWWRPLGAGLKWFSLLGIPAS